MPQCDVLASKMYTKPEGEYELISFVYICEKVCAADEAPQIPTEDPELGVRIHDDRARFISTLSRIIEHSI